VRLHDQALQQLQTRGSFLQMEVREHHLDGLRSRDRQRLLGSRGDDHVKIPAR